jgi:hypothetical protein
VAIDISGTTRAGFQLGGGFINERSAALHIFASNSAERSDLVEVLYDALYNKSIRIIDYSHGDYLDNDGFYNGSFIAPTVQGVSSLYFDKINSRHINFPSDWSDVNKYRAVINFTMFSYVD